MTEVVADDAMVTTTKAGKRLGYSKEQVRLLCMRGVFPGAFRNGPSGQWRIPLSEVVAYREKSRPKLRSRLIRP